MCVGVPDTLLHIAIVLMGIKNQNKTKKKNNQNRTIKTTLTATQKQNPQNELLIQYAPKTSGHTVTCNFPSSPTEISP